MEPFSRTMISSARRTALMRCAMISLVVFCSAFSVFCISCSVSISSAEVESSMIKIGVCFASALAMLIRCFCPPESPTPRSPMTVSYSSGIFSIKLLACASLDAFRTIASSIYSFLPSFTFSLMVSEKRNTSCITMEMLLRSCFKDSSRISTPSRRIQPSVAS